MKKQCKILFAGYGDIARRSAMKLESSEIEIIGLRRTAVNSQATGRNDQPVKLLQGNLQDEQKLTELLEQQFTVVVITLTPDEYSDQAYQNAYVNTAQSFANVVQRLAKPPELVIWVSSTSVYGAQQGQWVDEDSPVNPTSFAGKRLLEAESIMLELAKNAGLHTTVVRFSGIYGPGRRRLIDQVKQGKTIAAEPIAWSNRIHSEDCAGVLAHFVKQFQNGKTLEPLYIATDNLPVPLHEVYGWLRTQLADGKVAEKATEVAVSPSRANRRCSNRRLLESGYGFRYPTYREGYSKELLE